MQLALFESNAKPRIARVKDPATSQAAAVEVRPQLGDCQAKFLDGLEHLIASTGQPATAAEVAEFCYTFNPSKNRESYRKRAGELVKSGRISACGARRCRITGKLATTYRLASCVDAPS